jgi:hypothetical protein
LVGPDAALERELGKDLADRLNLMLGPPEVEPMMEDIRQLLHIWSFYPRNRDVTLRVREIGMVSGADLVWRLAARQGPVDVREGLASLLDRLEAPALLEPRKGARSDVGLCPSGWCA